MEEAVRRARSVLPRGTIYADWAARPLCVPSASEAEQHVWRHPHSDGGPTPSYARARRALQRFLLAGRETHHVVLTTGTTAGLASVATRLPWTEYDTLVCHTHSHKAVLGLRGPAYAAGARYIAQDSAQLHAALENSPYRVQRAFSENRTAITDYPSTLERCPFAVIAFPGECNLTGSLYPVSRWARAAHERDLSRTTLGIPLNARIVTLVDAAAFAASNPIAPGTFEHVDILVCSLYKITGAPTGVGALLVRSGSHAEELLMETSKSSYFAGGRGVAAISVVDPCLILPATSLVDSLELGTANLDAIARLPNVLADLETTLGGMQQIHKRACRVAHVFCREVLFGFREGTIEVYRGPPPYQTLSASHGPIVCFTVYQVDANGHRKPVGYREVEQILGLYQIHVRVGSMCNPGACADVLGLSEADTRHHFTRGHRCDDDMDLVDGRHTGVVRASFGWASLDSDAVRIAEVLRNHWGLRCVASPRGIQPAVWDENQLVAGQRTPDEWVGRVTGLYRYAVKGCLGEPVEVMYADLDDNGHCTGGVRGDRVLGIVCDESGELLTRKTCPSLDNVRATVREDETGSIFTVTLQLVDFDGANEGTNSKLSVLVESATGDMLSDVAEGREWLERYVGVRGKLCGARADGRRSLAMRGPSVHVVSLETCGTVAQELDGWNAVRVALAARANVLIEWKPLVRDQVQGSSLDEGLVERVDVPVEMRCTAAEAPTLAARGGVRLAEVRPCRRCPGMNVAGGEPLKTIARLAQADRNGVARPRRRNAVSFGVVARWTAGMGRGSDDRSDARTGDRLEIGEEVRMERDEPSTNMPADFRCHKVEKSKFAVLMP